MYLKMVIYSHKLGKGLIVKVEIKTWNLVSMLKEWRNLNRTNLFKVKTTTTTTTY